MVSRPPPGPPGAPRRSPKRLPGEDALSAIMGSDVDETVNKEEQTGRTSDSRKRLAEARILTALEKSKEPIPLVDLAHKVELGFVPLSELLINLQQQGICVVRGSPSHEVVFLAPDYK
jgi:hypothetical protein